MLLGYLGEVAAEGLKNFDLRGRATVAEVQLSVLAKIVNLIPQAGEIPAYPAVTRDVNLVVDEEVRWADVEQTVSEAALPFGEAVALQDVYRDAKRLGPGKKSLLFTLTLRSREGTLTNDEADHVRTAVVEACHKAHGGELRA